MGRVHSNVNPISRLQRRIPFFNQPASNDLAVDLSQEKDIDFYGRMRRKFETRAAVFFSKLHPPIPQNFDIPLSNTFSSITLPYQTSRKMETHLHIDPLEIKSLQREYSKDLYFSNIMKELSKSESFKSFHLSPDQLILFQDSSGRSRLCIPKSMTSDIMNETHNSIMGTAHAGFERSYA